MHANAGPIEATVAEAKRIFARLFVPVDFTMSSHRAVGAALELKRVFGSDICLFHLAEANTTDEFLGGLGNPAGPTDLVAMAEDRLRDFIQNVAPAYAGVVEVRARPDVNPLQDLRREAKRWRATLVVAAAEFRSGFFRSPAEKLVHGFDVPVLLIPPLAPGEASLGELDSP